jgi:hypothetical protein
VAVAHDPAGGHYRRFFPALVSTKARSSAALSSTRRPSVPITQSGAVAPDPRRLEMFALKDFIDSKSEIWPVIFDIDGRHRLMGILHLRTEVSTDLTFLLDKSPRTGHGSNGRISDAAFRNSFSHGEGNPVIEAYSLKRGRLRRFLMQFRGNSNIETPGKRFLRLFSGFLAQIKIIFNRLSQGFFQFVNGPTLKSNNIGKVQDIAVKNVRLRVVLKTPLIAFIGKYAHGVTPIVLKKRRTDFTAPLSVSG